MASFRRSVFTLFLGLSWTVPALADRIDGDWCSLEGGKTLTIKGPSIRIPSGAEITGEYDRHAFRYIGPEGDPEAGQEIRMRIFSDDDMGLVRIVGGAPQPEEQWLRCKPIA
jgi:hypothetical protein